MSAYYLVADIGGTNARFALVMAGESKLQQVCFLPCAEYATLQAAIKHYLQAFPQITLKSACFAVATAVHTPSFTLVNNHWHISKDEVLSELNHIPVYWVNDFAAQAIATTVLPKNSMIKINAVDKIIQQTRLAIGPGTGLGVCGLLPSTNGFEPISGEGGHASFAPNSKLQFEILKILQIKFERVSVERILSGPGILNLYQALAQINDQQVQCTSPAEITKAATGDNIDKLSIETLMLFCQIFGSVAGDIALNIGALGGVYITSDVIQNFLNLFLQSEFQQNFENKGRMCDYMASIPVYLVQEKCMGLIGATQILNKEEGL